VLHGVPVTPYPYAQDIFNKTVGIRTGMIVISVQYILHTSWLGVQRSPLSTSDHLTSNNRVEFPERHTAHGMSCCCCEPRPKDFLCST
jgi:hypothetical protein